jgi:small subunit ribosomal protein S6
MDRYETLLIIIPVLSDLQVKQVIDGITCLLQSENCDILNIEKWGLRQLAYSIQKKNTGYYVLIEFRAESAFIKKLDTFFRRDERFIRFLTFRQDKNFAAYAEKRRNATKSHNILLNEDTETKSLHRVSHPLISTTPILNSETTKQIINKNNTSNKCKRCHTNFADKKGSHLVPHFLLKRIENIEGKTQRDYEIGYVFEKFNVSSHFGRSVQDESIPRNPVLAKLFRIAKLCETAGYGFDKMLEWKYQTGNEVLFESTVDKTKFTFMLSENTVIKSTEKTIQKLSKNTEKILNLMAENPFITTAQLAENVEISVAAINKQIAKLKKQHLLRRDSADKGGKWVITNKE